MLPKNTTFRKSSKIHPASLVHPIDVCAANIYSEATSRIDAVVAIPDIICHEKANNLNKHKYHKYL